MDYHKVYTLLGFAAKARKCVFGSAGVENCYKNGRAALIVIDSGAENTIKKLTKTGVPCILLTEGRLGNAVGKDVKTVAITDQKFAEAIMKEYSFVQADGGRLEICRK